MVVRESRGQGGRGSRDQANQSFAGLSEGVCTLF